MAKQKTVFTCAKCDAQYPKWQGRCSECSEWGTIKEEIVIQNAQTKNVTRESALVTKLDQVSMTSFSRFPSGSRELDRVFGGGIVPGSVYVVTGDPGIGKSTLLLHLASSVKQPVLYVSGEESLEQVKNRVERLNVSASHIGFVSETIIGSVRATIEQEKPALTIVDSLQTMKDDELSQDPGSITQMKAVTAQLVESAKSTKSAICIVGHITKTGAIAGPKTLEHLVDGVLYLEGTPHNQYRLLRATKNRFGSVDEVGVFEMTEKGLEEVKDPSQVFLVEHQERVSGSAVSALIEGSRVFFVEFQALVSRTSFGYPVRKSVGFDNNRLQMLVAVLQKRLKLPLHDFDVHVNVAGGITFKEPASDAAVVASIISALKNIPLPKHAVLFGEVGLAGEIRPVSFLEKRVKEAKQLGYKIIFGPKSQKTIEGLTVVQSVKELGDRLFS